jgi:hypothetical protein
MKSLYRRIRYGEPVIIVSGLPRSGTSMTMQMLAAGGVKVVTDGVRKPGEDNPKGYYEDVRVKDLAEDDVDRTWVRDARGKAIKIISFLLNYLPENNNYKVIFMRRDLSEVLASQQKMLDRHGEENDTDDEKMLEVWKDHLWKVNYLMTRADRFELLNVPYRDVVAKPIEQARRIKEFLGLSVEPEQMAGAVDEKLYRNRSKT